MLNEEFIIPHWATSSLILGIHWPPEEKEDDEQENDLSIEKYKLTQFSSIYYNWLNIMRPYILQWASELWPKENFTYFENILDITPYK